MKHEKPTLVTVEVLLFHTFDGEPRTAGSTYEIDPVRGESGYPFLDTLEAGGLVRRLEEQPKRRAK
jgi:hypothetical protein